MPPQKQADPPLIRKSYLYLLPVIALGLGLNLAFNREARDLLGLKPGNTIQIKLFKKRAAPPARPEAAAIAFSAEEFRAFAESFTRKTPGVIVVPTKPLVTGTNGPVIPPDTPMQIWPVQVQGTYRDSAGQWVAIIAGQNIRVGDRLETEGVPNACRYRVLAVGRKSVWLLVIPPEAVTPPAIPEVEWPDVAMIELDRKGVFRSGYVPARVRLASGETLGRGDKLEYEATGALFKVTDLWATGAVFEASKGEARVQIACALPLP